MSLFHVCVFKWALIISCLSVPQLHCFVLAIGMCVAMAFALTLDEIYSNHNCALCKMILIIFSVTWNTCCLFQRQCKYKNKRSKVFSSLHNKTWPSQEKTEKPAKVLHLIWLWILMFRGDGLSLGNAMRRIYTSSLVRWASSLNENEALAHIGLLSASHGSPSPTPNSFEYRMLIYDLIWSVFCMQMPEASLGTCIMRFSGSSLLSVTAL